MPLSFAERYPGWYMIMQMSDPEYAASVRREMRQNAEHDEDLRNQSHRHRDEMQKVSHAINVVGDKMEEVFNRIWRGGGEGNADFHKDMHELYSYIKAMGNNDEEHNVLTMSEKIEKEAKEAQDKINEDFDRRWAIECHKEAEWYRLYENRREDEAGLERGMLGGSDTPHKLKLPKKKKEKK
jgi:uncharacterized membrane protein